LGDKLSNEDIAEIEGVMDVANFGTALAAICEWTLTEDNDMRLSCKGCHLWRWELLQTGDSQVGN